MTTPVVNRPFFDQQLARLDLSLRQLGRLMHLSHSQLSLTFSGKRRMQLDEAAQLARIFGVPLAVIAHHAGINVSNGQVARRLPIVGIMQGDGRVIAHEGESVTAPEGLPTDAVAIQARTHDSPLAWMDGWLMYARRPKGIEAGAVGRFCWVSSRGEQYIGTLRHGYAGHSYSLSPPGHLDSQPLDWASSILLTQHV